MQLRDNQRTAIYRWERKVPLPDSAHEVLSMPQARKFIDQVWARYIKKRECVQCHGSGVCRTCREGRCHACKGKKLVRPRPPVILDGRGTRRAWGTRRELSIPRRMRTRAIICHEVAHSILDLRGCREAPHGKMFAALLLDMFDKVLGGHRKACRAVGASQRPRRVHYAFVKDLYAFIGPRRRERHHKVRLAATRERS